MQLIVTLKKIAKITCLEADKQTNKVRNKMFQSKKQDRIFVLNTKRKNQR